MTNEKELSMVVGSVETQCNTPISVCRCVSTNGDGQITELAATEIVVARGAMRFHKIREKENSVF